MKSKTDVEMTLRLGLGDALRRLNWLDKMYSHGSDATGSVALERQMLLDALNRIPVELPVSCLAGREPNDLDGDNAVSFFEFAAQSSCECRIPKAETSRFMRKDPRRKRSNTARLQ